MATGGTITVCGAGALGGNTAEILARMGIGPLRLVDRDRVEQRNVPTQPYLRAEVGAPKARALAATLYRAVQARVEPVVAELTGANAETLLAGSALVVDAFDNRDARKAVSEAARSLMLPCLHAGFSADGLYGNGAWEPNYVVPKEAAGEPCEVPANRPFVVTVAALTARAVADYLRGGRRHTFELTWGDLRIRYDCTPD